MTLNSLLSNTWSSILARSSLAARKSGYILPISNVIDDISSTLYHFRCLSAYIFSSLKYLIYLHMLCTKFSKSYVPRTGSHCTDCTPDPHCRGFCGGVGWQKGIPESYEHRSECFAVSVATLCASGSNPTVVNLCVSCF